LHTRTQRKCQECHKCAILPRVRTEMLRAQFISLHQKIAGFREFHARDRLREISMRSQQCSRKPTKVKNKGTGSSSGGVCICVRRRPASFLRRAVFLRRSLRRCLCLVQSARIIIVVITECLAPRAPWGVSALILRSPKTPGSV
jgi:hypothetical protein